MIKINYVERILTENPQKIMTLIKLLAIFKK